MQAYLCYVQLGIRGFKQCKSISVTYSLVSGVLSNASLSLVLTVGYQGFGVQQGFGLLFRHFRFHFIQSLIQLSMTNELDTQIHILTDHHGRRPIGGLCIPGNKDKEDS